MHHFHYRGHDLTCEEVPVRTIAAAVGTPCYIYSEATLRRHFHAFDGAFSKIPHLTCFSMKSNSTRAILSLFAAEGGGVDIVSGGELYRALKAGVPADRIVYSGVGKSSEDLRYALSEDILLFNVESPQELDCLNAIAGDMGKRARIALRVNPDVDPKTHPYISTGLRENKFGIAIEDAPGEYRRASDLAHILVAGVSCHIGSQVTTISPFLDALERLLLLVENLRELGLGIRYLDIGGGLGITYDQEAPPHPVEYAAALAKRLKGRDLTLILEPGRVLVGNAGILLCRVLYTKTSGEKIFYVVDAAMNDLMRPALYRSFHGILPVRKTDGPKVTADIVGPICESGDFIAKARAVDLYGPGDLMAIMSAGAYGFSMSSNYNSRPRVCEVMVRKDRFAVVRRRETYEDLVRGESLPEFLSVAAPGAPEGAASHGGETSPGKGDA